MQIHKSKSKRTWLEAYKPVCTFLHSLHAGIINTGNGAKEEMIDHDCRMLKFKVQLCNYFLTPAATNSDTRTPF